MAVQIYGIQRAQAAMLQAVEAVRPSGGLGRAIQGATAEAHRRAVAKTHVDTGALRGSHTMRVNNAHGEVFISSSARRSDGRRPAEYGPYEHARGGEHAFYERVVREDGAAIGRAAMSVMMAGLP